MSWMSNPGYRAQRYRSSSNSPQPSVIPGLITRSGKKLLRNGEEFIFTGLNMYNANSDGNYWYNLALGDELDKAMDDAGSGIEIIRAWFGQWLAHPRVGDIDWTYFDHTFDTAQRHGKQVIAVLADQDGSWCDGIRKTYDSGWYQSGYRTTVSTVPSHWDTYNTMTYRDFAVAVAERYRNHPGVAFWQLINEAEIKTEDESRMTSELEDAAAVVLRDWANDMASAIKQVDPNHLINVGSIGTGQFGTSGPRYELVHSGSDIDLCEMHDYEASKDGLGDEYNGMELRLQQAARLNKPLFVGEVGIKPEEAGGLEARAARFRAKIEYQRGLGVAGHVAWVWRNTDAVGGTDGYDIKPGDPALDVLRAL